MNAIQERVKEISEKLETGVKELFESDRYREYLKTMSKLHHYSASNILLMYMQKQDISMVAGMTKWNKEFHRYINKGEKGLVILAPSPYKKTVEKDALDENGQPKRDKDGNVIKEKKQITIESYRPVYVYDISQTNGQPVERLHPEAPTENVDRYDEIMAALKEIAPCPIEFEKVESGNGYFSPTENRIAIKEGMSESLTIRCMIHEIGHSLLHNLESKGAEIDRDTKEVEAESVSFCVSNFLGISTEDYAFPYIAGWAGSKQTESLKDSMEKIRKCAAEIISGLNEKLQLQPDLEKRQTKIEKNARSI